MGAVIVGDHTCKDRIRAAFSREFNDDDACEGLGGIAGTADGGELGANLDGGRDNVGRVRRGVGVIVITVLSGLRFDRIISTGVIGLWNPTPSGGSIATWIETGSFAVAHTSEGSKFCEKKKLGLRKR
jgi:hypothetical protein